MKSRGLLWKVIEWVIFLGVAGMLITVSLQIGSRLAGRSLPWTEEMTRNLFIWTIFLGMAVGFRNADHIRVTFLLKLFPRTLKKAQMLIYLISTTTFFMVLIRMGYLMSLRQFRSAETAPATGIPMFLVTIPITLSSVLAIIGTYHSIFWDKHTNEIILGDSDELGDKL